MRGRSGVANDAWEALLTAHAQVMKDLLAEPSWADISMREYDVLYALSKQDAAIRLSELNRRVLLSQPALSRMIDRLAQRGLIARESDPHDRRGILLTLTPDGRAAQRTLGRQHGLAVARAMTQRLTLSELEHLESLCRKMSGSSALIDR